MLSKRYNVTKTLSLTDFDSARAVNLDPAGFVGPDEYLHLLHNPDGSHVSSGTYIALFDAGSPGPIWRNLRLDGDRLGTVSARSRISDDQLQWTAWATGIAGGAGRYLELELTLTAQEGGTQSPTVTGISVDCLLPIRSLPIPLTEYDPELATLAEVLGEGLYSLRPSEELDRFLTVAAMNDELVARWLAILGWRWWFSVEPADKRRLLKALLTLYRLGGTVQGLMEGVKFFIGLDVVKVKEDWPEAYPGPMDDDLKRNITVYITNYPYGEDTLAMIPYAQQVVDLLKPFHAHAVATVVRNRVQDIGHITINDAKIYRKTIRYITYMPL